MVDGPKLIVRSQQPISFVNGYFHFLFGHVSTRHREM